MQVAYTLGIQIVDTKDVLAGVLPLKVKRFLPFPSLSVSPAVCPSSSQTPSDGSWAVPGVRSLAF